MAWLIIVLCVAQFIQRSKLWQGGATPSFWPQLATPSWATTHLWFSWCVETLRCSNDLALGVMKHDAQWEMTKVGFSPVEWYWVNWCPINPINSTQLHPKNENGSKISRAKLSGILSPQVQWCQEHYLWIYSNQLYQARFNGLWLACLL